MVRAALGVILTGGPLLFVELSPATLAIFGGLASVFALFGVRTILRSYSAIELGEIGVTVRGVPGGDIAWQQLNGMKLGYYTTRRDRQGGWMQLTLQGGGKRLRFDSTLEGFDRLLRRATQAATANGVALASATLANLAAMDIAVPQTATLEQAGRR
ncbi:MAG: hypothetical protein ABI439_04310 [Rhodospirillales bacterium]